MNRNGFTGLADYAVVSRAGDHMKAVIEAVKLRREGLEVETQFSGNFKKQMARAKERAREVIVI